MAKNTEYGTVLPTHQVEYKGNTATIFCFSLTKTKWTKNGKHISDSHSIKGVLLYIFYVKNRSSGNYTCHGTKPDKSPFEATSELLVGGNAFFIKIYLLFLQIQVA